MRWVPGGDDLVAANDTVNREVDISLTRQIANVNTTRLGCCVGRLGRVGFDGSVMPLFQPVPREGYQWPKVR